MKKTFFRKAVSVVCAATVSVSSFVGLSATVSAAGAVLGYWPEPLEIPNQFYYENETLQPYGSCFLIDELKNWSPDNDPDARYNRGAIELRDRWMGPSVNPNASRDAKIMPLAMSNARASEAPSQGGDGDFVYAFNNFQYVDIFNFWGGSSAEGPIAIPSPEVIDSAHRNGVPATGTIFIPWGDSAYGNQFVSEMLEKDAEGHYIAADKLIEIAQYYGFDGYIFNAESGTGVSGFKDFLAYLQRNKPDNFTITWYNGSGGLSSGSIKSWMQDGDTRITDEWWLDMSGGGNVDSTIQAAQECGVDPWNIHSTWEYWPMSGMPGTKGGNYQTRLDATGKLKCSLGILAPTCTLTQATSSDDYMNVQDQKLWVGPTFDPSSTYRPESEFCGFANLVADRTPVIGTDFVTTFTTGNGYKFYEDGVVTGKESGWYNRSLTDVLPTWRWIIDSEGQKLSAKIDYDDAWYAGTSMKLYGSMDANKQNHVKLYSAQLDITGTTTFSITYKTAKAGVDLSLGLCYGDSYADENFKFYPVTTTANGEWTTATVDLSGDAGKRAIAISLKLNAPAGVSDYALNVGRMAFTTDNAAPAAASSVTLDEVIYPTDKTMEARVYWEKADNAFMYRIHRVYADGTREFVGATPSDAFYLGSFTKDGDETSCTFEITSYSENGVKGGTKTFEIDWPTEVQDGFVPVFEEGENLALGKPAVSSVSCVADGPVHLINDGVISNSKWCSNAYSGYAVIDLGEEKDIQRWVVYHANCKGAGEGVDYNTVDFDLQYAGDDGQPLLTGNDSASQNRVRALTFTRADAVTNNKQDVTDRNLNAPIKARYIKLNVTKNCNSAWSAIRIYELQIYEKAAISNTASPYERNVTVKNNVGAADTVVVDNVTMKYSSGSYQDKNGAFHQDTGKVRLFTDLTSEEPIAIVNATQPNESYKQRSVGIAKFENLELNPEGGRLFYDVLDGSGVEVTNSRRASVYYAPESGTASNAPDSVKLERTTVGYQLRKQYGKFTATGIEEGAVIKFFDSENAESPILHSLPAKADGVITQTRVPMEKAGGAIYYEIHKEGKPDSERFALTYGDPMALTADLSGLNELIAKCDAISEADCTSATWPAFAAELASAKNTAAGTPTGAEAEAARAALAKAYASLRYKNRGQRLGELCEEFEAAYPQSGYTQDSFRVFKAKLEEAKAMVAGYDSSGYQIEQMRIKLEAAVRGLVEGSGVVTGVTVTPSEVSLEKGGSGFSFTAEVTGSGDVSQEVTWAVSGNTDSFTQMRKNILYVGPNETAKTLTVTATSVTDPSVFGTAVVTVIGNGEEPGESVLLSGNADVLGVGSTTGTTDSQTANFAFDGSYGTKWCSEKTPNWVVFDIKEAATPDRLKVTHAGGATEREDERLNTNDFALQVLDTSKLSEADFLAKTESERAAIMADDSYWTTVKSYTGNEQNVTDDPISVAGKVRLFRFVVTDGDDNWWNGPDTLRVYEIEVFGKKDVTPPASISVSISPETMEVNSNPGQKGQFTATVTGTDNIDVEWTISGNTSAQTMITNGQLFLGEDETAKTLTVTATSVADPTKSASATVTIYDPVYAITVSDSVQNGTIAPDVEEASKGTTITLTITPDDGYRLRAGTLKVNGTAIEGTTFTMPNEAAFISAEFVKTADLEALIDETNELNGEAYTSSTWAAVTEKCAAAESVLNDETSSQVQIDAARSALQAALDALVARGDKTALQEEVDLVDLDPAELPEDFPLTAEFMNALASAKAVLADEDATQDEIDAAYDALVASEELQMSAAMLYGVIVGIDEVVDEGLDQSFTSESWAALMEEYENAKAMLENVDEATAEEIMAQIEKIGEMIEALVPAGDSDALAGLIETAKKEDLDKYTDESAEAIREAIAKAEEVIANRGTEEELDEAYAALEKALTEAELKPVIPEKPDTPDTGDYAPIALPVVLTALAAGMFLLKKKRSAR